MTPDDGVLVCEFSKRPRGAPSLFDIAPAIRRLTREPGALVVEFDPGATAGVHQCVAAERLCCPTITWELEDGEPLRLRIVAAKGPLQTLAAMLTGARATA